MKIYFNFLLLSAITFFSGEVASDYTQLGSNLDGEAANDSFGTALAMSDDGMRIFIGAKFNDGNGSKSGHVRVYEYEYNLMEANGSKLVMRLMARLLRIDLVLL